MIIIKLVLCTYLDLSQHVETEEGNSNFKLYQLWLRKLSPWQQGGHGVRFTKWHTIGNQL